MRRSSKHYRSTIRPDLFVLQRVAGQPVNHVDYAARAHFRTLARIDSSSAKAVQPSRLLLATVLLALFLTDLPLCIIASLTEPLGQTDHTQQSSLDHASSISLRRPGFLFHSFFFRSLLITRLIVCTDYDPEWLSRVQ